MRKTPWKVKEEAEKKWREKVLEFSETVEFFEDDFEGEVPPLDGKCDKNGFSREQSIPDDISSIVEERLSQQSEDPDSTEALANYLNIFKAIEDVCCTPTG